MAKIRVLIADDSVVYRSQIKAALATFSNVEVVGVASNGRLAIDRLLQTEVDLLILDIEMPEVDGLQTLAEIVKRGMSVKTLVFSSASKPGAEKTLEALRLGAQDFATKPGGGPEEVPGETRTSPTDRITALLQPKLKALFPDKIDISDESPERSSSQPSQIYPKVPWEIFKPKVVVIGSSTGGPTVLEKIFIQIGQLTTSPDVPILVVQHMPPIFTASLAERISRLSGIPAKEGANGDVLKPGTIYIAPGDFHMTIEGTPLLTKIRLNKGPAINSVRPSVDPLFKCVAQIFKKKCLGIILTGMGQDGKVGSEAIKEAGGAVLIQDRSSSVVYGMPGAVEESGAFDKICGIEEIGTLLQDKICTQYQVKKMEEKKGA